MTYEQALEKIHSLDKFGSRPGLQRIQKLFSMLGDDLLEQKFIHVAGTNGKGSVCQMLSNVLRESGYKTGLFISPYITNFLERVQINNEMIEKRELCDAVEHLSPMLDTLNEQGIIITEFEFLTALAFYVFKKNGCDIIVCETGLGGLLDSTNLIKKPLCSVLTKIDLDHTAILGDTIELITEQKCGIIKSDSITVTSSQNDVSLEIIKETAKAKNNKLYLADDIEFSDIILSCDGCEFSYDNKKLSIPLVGEHQLQNAKTAICTLSALKENSIIDFTDDNLKNGFKNACNPARFELMSKSPIVFLDGAHNVNGISAFKNAVERFTEQKRVLLIGMLKDKDVENAIELIKDMFDIVVVTDVPNIRNMDCYELADVCKRYFENVVISSTPQVAFDLALNIAKDNEYALCICGSLYLAGELRPYIIEKLNN
ncbi:MAG: bifunctional folylpolyglutamate synthase/dihydrofolate synthase [Ruminococcaceae bacterium]|nr:bifunctional folylpolyglutamate synthase/dihydrofolate synthase [Oscillospiraceae bacterium]